MRKKLRPKGCTKTISGRHIPARKDIPGWMEIIEFHCTACGLIDDTGKFEEYLWGKPKKIDDANIK